MPCVTALARSRILERLELQVVGREAGVRCVGEQLVLVCGHQMRHRAPLPDVTVQPQSTVHRVDHPIAPARELTKSYTGFGTIMSHPLH